jgi:RNA polymerase sigma factor (sigma-70 family)
MECTKGFRRSAGSFERVRVRGGSLDELEALYRERYPAFLRVARATVRDNSAAADAVHDAFVQAVRNRRSFRGDGTLEAWVWRMVVNAARKRCRDLPPREGDPVEPPDGSRNGFGDPVRAAVAALPERQRLALFLRYYADLDYASIAAALGIAEGTVGATLNAAHAALRESLKEADPCET